MNNIYMPKRCKLLKIEKMQGIEWLFTVEFDEETKPGQFMQVSLPKIGECPISITRHDKETKEMEFLIRQVGKVTSEIFELNIGDTLFLRGPYGSSFDFDKFRGKSLVVISGGSGLAPVRPIVNEFYKEKNFKLLSGFKDENGILFSDEINKWKQVNDNIFVTLDDNKGDDKYLNGMVTNHLNMLLEDVDTDNMTVVVVGPPIMMHFVTKALKEFNIKDSDIVVSFERNMSCAVGKCGHCKIDETYICLEGPVFTYEKAKDLLD